MPLILSLMFTMLWLNCVRVACVCVGEISSNGNSLAYDYIASLVPACVGFGDLEMTENMVQTMREGRKDLCMILRDLNFDD